MSVAGMAGSSLFGEPPGDGERLSHFPDCVVSGAANPMGTAIAVRREADDAVAEVVLGAAFEGAPGRAHGGVVAAIFDDVMGYQLSILKVPAFTGRIEITYRHPAQPGHRRGGLGRVGRRGDRGRPTARRPDVVPLQRPALGQSHLHHEARRSARLLRGDVR